MTSHLARRRPGKHIDQQAEELIGMVALRTEEREGWLGDDTSGVCSWSNQSRGGGGMNPSARRYMPGGKRGKGAAWRNSFRHTARLLFFSRNVVTPLKMACSLMEWSLPGNIVVQSVRGLALILWCWTVLGENLVVFLRIAVLLIYVFTWERTAWNTLIFCFVDLAFKSIVIRN